MSIERDPDAIVDAWLEEGPTWLPDPTRRAIAVSIRTTHRTRRPDRVTRRFSTMNGLSRYALAAAAVVAVAVGGTLLFDVGPPAGVGGDRKSVV